MDKLALITGANKGIGFETARQLKAKGCKVLLGARDQARGQKAASELGVDFIKIDPTNADSVMTAAEYVLKNFGHLDILVNNAGYFHDQDGGDVVEIDTRILKETYEINVFGLHEVTKQFWNLLNRSQAARLVNVSSILGSISLNGSGTFGDFKALAYASSKAAVNMLTVQYASNWKNTLHKANAIHPGSVKTDMNPNGELDLEQGAQTSVEMALLGAEGPNGKFFHLGNELPW